MRAISLINRLEFDFSGNVARNALTLGDVDNDGDTELIVGNESGEVVIFKGKQKWEKISDFNFITCIAVGDVLNIQKNCLVVVTADGWCHVYYCPTYLKSKNESDGADTVDGQAISGESTGSDKHMTSESIDKDKLKCVHVQRIPANTMDIIIGDIDGDGLMEIVFGLTDRVVRSYRWMNRETEIETKSNETVSDFISGQFVGLSKWECANQIGSITLNHTLNGKPCILVSQPGGTFMRITCEEASFTSSENDGKQDSSSIKSENLMGSSIDYQFLGLSRMRNQNISTEIVGDLNNLKIVPDKAVQESSSECQSVCSRSRPYSVATLDGTIMLVQDEVILWAMAVDHQIFALEKLDVTQNGSDDIIACTWDGYTYILDQDRNSVRFQVGEPVQAFCCGYYTLTPEEEPLTCLVYVTFRNKIYLFYDIPLSQMVIKKFEPDLRRFEQLVLERHGETDALKNLEATSKKKLVEYLLYGVKKK